MGWIPDRFWWVQRYGGGVLSVGGIIAAVWCVIQAIDAYQVAQLPGDPRGSAILRNLALSFLASGAAYALFAIRFIVSLQASFPARERYRRRRQAMQGDQEVMPRAAVAVNPQAAPRLSGEPLELLWRVTPFASRIMTTLYTLMILIFGLCAVLCWYLAYCLVTNTPPIGSAGLEPISLSDRMVGVTATVILGAMLLFLVVFMIRLLPWERGRPYGVSASSDGLWYYPKGRRRRFVRWNEACLLEVSVARGRRHRVYRLYGRHAVAEWWELPPSRWVSLGMTSAEFGERYRAMLNLIVARTWLLPRTLDSKLVEPQDAVAPLMSKRE